MKLTCRVLCKHATSRENNVPKEIMFQRHSCSKHICWPADEKSCFVIVVQIYWNEKEKIENFEKD